MAELQAQRNNLLLLNKVLSSRDNISPFTLIIDDLEQTSKPLLRVFKTRAKAIGSNVVYISFSPRCRSNGDIVINGLNRDLESLQAEIKSRLLSKEKTLVIFESLNALAASYLNRISTFLSSFIAPSVNLVAVYHNDVTYPCSRQTLEEPEPLRLLRYIATTLINMHSFSHVVAEKRARDRSVMAPEFGLAEALEGIVTSTSNNNQSRFVIEMEHRRRSGRSVREWFFLTTRPRDMMGNSWSESQGNHGQVSLLIAHPLMRPDNDHEERNSNGMETMDTTFNLQLTDRQRSDRDEVNLPYFDAQRKEGIGEGGRILYEMGVEDDFDDEEDEI